MHEKAEIVMQQRGEKRKLDDYLHYFFSEDRGQEVPQESKDQQQAKSIVSLCHFASQETSRVEAFISLAEQYLKYFKQVFIITSRFDEENVLLQVPTFGFSRIKDPVRDVSIFVNADQSIRYALMAEHRLLRPFLANDFDRHMVGGGATETTLFLFDAQAFGCDFLDVLCTVLDHMMIVTDGDIGHLIEGYQCIKSYVQINSKVNCQYLVLDEDKKRAVAIRDTICSLSKEHLRKNVDIIYGSCCALRLGSVDTSSRYSNMIPEIRFETAVDMCGVRQFFLCEIQKYIHEKKPNAIM